MRPVPPTAWYLPVVGVTPVIRGMGGRYAAAFGDASWRGFRYDLVLAAAALRASLPASASMATTAATYKVVKTIKLGTSTKNYDPTGITVAADGSPSTWPTTGSLPPEWAASR